MTLHRIEQEHDGRGDFAEWHLEQLQVAERPTVALREVEQPSRVEAAFALELVGVSRGERRLVAGRQAGPRTLDRLLAGLEHGQQLTINYAVRPGADGSAVFAWTLAARARGRTTAEARDRACRCWRDVLVNLTAFAPDCRFAPAADPSACLSMAPLAHSVRVRPAGLRVGCHERLGIGFATASTRPNARDLLVAAVGHPSPGAISSLAQALVRQHQAVRVAVTYAPLVLAPCALDLFRAGAEWARRTDPRDIECHAGAPDDLADAPNRAARLASALESWLRNPRGYRVTCQISCVDPVPAALVSMVGAALFGHASPASIEPAADSSDRRPASRRRCLDLRDCVNGGSLAPALLPSTATLLECGFTAVPAPAARPLAPRGVVVGRTHGGLMAHDVRFSPTDRSRHMYVCGATGSGKSTLLYNMALQDMESGDGVCVIDPHGDLYRQMLASVPQRRVDDVVLIDPSDAECAVGINFIECAGPHRPMQMNFVTNELIRIFDRLYDLRETGGPMFEQYMRNAVLLVIDNECPDGTLLDIPALFEDEGFRRQLKGTCRNPLVERFWSRQAERAGGEASLANMAPYVTSKLNQFTTNAVLRPIVGQPRSTIDLRAAMDEGRIVLVNLSRGVLGELDTQLLGMLLIGQLFTAALSRAGSAGERRPFYVYVDEFQHFTTDTVAHVLSESRKFGLALTLANQTLSQLLVNRGRQNVLDAVLGNCGTMLTFRLGSIDAQRLEPYTKPELLARDLQDLPDFHAAARMLAGNRPTRPFVLATLPPQTPVSPADPALVVTTSREKYARPVAEVERDILRRRGVGDAQQ
jgi:hypothetical protein